MKNRKYYKDELKTIRFIIKWISIVLSIFMITVTIVICARSINNITITYNDISVSVNK